MNFSSIALLLITSAPIKVASTTEVCSEDAHCVSGACAKSEPVKGAKNVCCASGEYWFAGSCFFASEGDFCGSICSGQSAGAACHGYDEVCKSGACDSDGGMCLAEDGDACSEDSICKNKFCILGQCQDSKQEVENDPCEKDADCASGSCLNQDVNGLGSCGPFASLAARNDYFNDSADCPLDTLSQPDPSDVSTVTLQVYEDIKTGANQTQSGLFDDSKKPDSSATTNVLVGQEVMDGIDGCFGGNSVIAQRQGNQVCFSYQKEDDDGKGNSSFSCSKNCIDVGSSDEFATYNLSYSSISFGLATFEYELRLCRIEVESGGVSTTPTLATTDGSGATTSVMPSPFVLAPMIAAMWL